MNESTLSKEQIQLSREMVKFSLGFCNACFFGNPSDEGVKVNNGTMTLVKYGGELYGITNFHVIESYRERLTNESDLDFYIGNTSINLNEVLIDEDKDLDLCTLRLSQYEEDSFGSCGEIPTHFFELDDFSDGDITVGAFVLFGVCPGVWRTRPESNYLIFDSLSSGSTEVTEVTARNIRCELALDKCVVTLKQHHDEFPNNLGGLSGGPVFLHQIHASGVSTFKLVWFIYEHMAEYDSILVRPISYINENFEIVR